MSKTQKISAASIKVGDVIRVRKLTESNLQDKIHKLIGKLGAENVPYSYKASIERDIESLKKCLKNGYNKLAIRGAILKSSPTLTVIDIKNDGPRWSYVSNGRQVSFRDIAILTKEYGYVLIDSRIKVEVL